MEMSIYLDTWDIGLANKEDNMSRVTIKDLYWEIAQETYANNVWMKYKDIEVVPRKMVEMIITECNSQISDFHHNPSIVNTATHIKDYAESLLKQFEEDK